MSLAQSNDDANPHGRRFVENLHVRLVFSATYWTLVQELAL